MDNISHNRLAFVRTYLSTWNWRLYFFILLFLSLPNIYQVYRTSIIGTSLPDPGSLAIVSQWQFVGLVVEIFQEATVLAIFFFVGSQIHSNTAVHMDRAKTVLFIIFVASLGVVQILVFQAYLMSLYLHFIAFDFLYMVEFSRGRI